MREFKIGLFKKYFYGHYTTIFFDNNYCNNTAKMPSFDRDALILALKVSSTAALGLYAGSSIYINAVEVPAALDYDAEHGLMCWQSNFKRASRFCVSLS